MMHLRFFLAILGIVFYGVAGAQTLQLRGQVSQRSSLLIEDALHRYEVIKLDERVRNVENITGIQLQWGELDFAAPVQAYKGPVHEVLLLDDMGKESLSSLTVWRGKNARGEVVNMALNEGFVMGEFFQKGQLWMLEQARNIDPGFSDDYLILYQPGDVRNKDVSCGVDDTQEAPAATAFGQKSKTVLNENTLSTCRTIEYAIAADHTSFLRHGGLQQTANYILGIMNLVGTNYVGVFNDDFQYKINQMLVYTSRNSNPWPPTDNISEHLTNFFSAATTLFSRPFDLCSYWFSTTGFSSGTVGLAYMRFTCNNRGSNAIREYGATANSMRVLVAHEIGHNLSAEHDATTGFIMSPSINNTTTWSTQSRNSINNWMAGANANCFTACNNTACETELLGGVSMLYDTASNQIRVRWTQVPGEAVRIRWLNKSLNTWDSITSAELNGQFNINNACNNSREYRVEIMKRCGAAAFAVNSATWVLTAAFQPDIDFGSSASFCTGTTKQLTSRYQQAGHQYRWYRSGALLAGQTSPSITVGTGGDYRLEVNNGNGCWLSSAVVPLFVSDKPITKFGYSFISPTQVQLSDSSDLANGFSWQFDNGITSTEKDPPIQYYATNGLKNISLTATGCGGKATVTQPVLIGHDVLYQNINPWGTHSGIAYQGTECSATGRFTTADLSRHALTVATQFPNEGTIEWRFFPERGYNASNPSETNIVYLAGNVLPNSVSGRFSVAINMTTQLLTVRVLNGNASTNYNANISQMGVAFNTWIIFGLSYGNQGLQVRVNGTLVTWSGSTGFSLGGPATISGQNNLVATGQHYNPTAGGTVGFEGLVSHIRVSALQRNYLLEHPTHFLQSAASGNWNATRSWLGRSPALPLPCDSVVINAGHQMEVGTQASARHVHIRQGGTLQVNNAAANLQIGLSSARVNGLVSRGVFNFGQGEVRVMGFVNLDSGTFQMGQAAKLKISGNSGNALTSLSDGVPLFRAGSGLSSFSLQGELHITDPPFGATSHALHSNFHFGKNSLLRLGIGNATLPGQNPQGFGGNQFPTVIGRFFFDGGHHTGNRHFISINPLTIFDDLKVNSGHFIQQELVEVKE